MNRAERRATQFNKKRNTKRINKRIGVKVEQKTAWRTVKNNKKAVESPIRPAKKFTIKNMMHRIKNIFTRQKVI